MCIYLLRHILKKNSTTDSINCGLTCKFFGPQIELCKYFHKQIYTLETDIMMYIFASTDVCN